METGICHYITGEKLKAFSLIQFFMQEYPLHLHCCTRINTRATERDVIYYE